MIPYEDLVVALQSWRVKQGLPVGQLSGQLTPPPVQAEARPTPPPAPRTAPPVAPPRPGTPPPLRSGEETLDVDDGAMMLEAAYEPEGADFAMSFADKVDEPPADGDHESTQIGGPPSRPSESTEPGGLPPRPNNRNDDW